MMPYRDICEQEFLSYLKWDQVQISICLCTVQLKIIGLHFTEYCFKYPIRPAGAQYRLANHTVHFQVKVNLCAWVRETPSYTHNSLAPLG